MVNSKYKSKRFLLPILSLVLISIIAIASINSYMTVSMFKTHMKEHIEQTKKEYTQKQKNRVYKEVNFVNDSIKFQITKIENRLKASLKEKVKVALNIATFIYNNYKNTHNKEEIKEKIAQALGLIKFNDNRGYYFMYDNQTKVIFGHPMKKFVGKDMTNFRDSRGQSLMELDENALEKNDIGYSKIYFNKPNNQEEEFPKITCFAKFKPLDLVLGIGEYLDVIENERKQYVLERFSKFKNDKSDQYLVILDIHNLKGGDEFATVLLNSNRPELEGKKISDKVKDIKGNRFRKDFLNLVNEKGEGYTKYWYKKPSTKLPTLKMSYIYLQKDWNWLILSGFYYEDLEKQISIMKNSVNIHTNEVINKTILWVCLLSFLAILVAIFVSLKIDKTIKKYTNTIIEFEDNKRKQESLLLQQSKMAAMGEMLGNIAHQWRQPLSVISTCATGAKLQNEVGLLNNTNIDSYFDTINNTAQHLSQTIEDFRTFFNPKEDNLKVFQIKETIEKALNLVSAQFVAKDIKIIDNIDNSKLLSLENELIQALVNILNNSRDALLAIEKDKKRLIFIKTSKNKENILIEIYDNANGIPEDIINRIFEPYFTTKHQSQGTGIGLYMTQEIITKLLHGLIKVENINYVYENETYKGAKFTIELPSLEEEKKV